MMPIGSRPVLWHVMRYYAHFGHTEFILCLGYGAHAVKDYFLDYRETTSNDFVLAKGGEHVEMLGTDISDWTITFVDTGLDTAIGERLRRVRPYLEDDEVFLANYGDVLTDAPAEPTSSTTSWPPTRSASMLAVKPQDSFHVVDIAEDDRVTGLDRGRRHGDAHQRRATSSSARASSTTSTRARTSSWTRASGQPADGRLHAVPYDGFWAPDGHAQGAHRPRGAVPQRRPARGRCGATGPWTAPGRPTPVRRSQVDLDLPTSAGDG